MEENVIILLELAFVNPITMVLLVLVYVQVLPPMSAGAMENVKMDLQEMALVFVTVDSPPVTVRNPVQQMFLQILKIVGVAIYLV
jgi:hypothetical protein